MNNTCEHADAINLLDERLRTLVGLNPDEIVALLQGKGITGHPGSPYDCPLANYFREGMPGQYLVVVDPRGIKLFSDIPPLVGLKTTVRSYEIAENMWWFTHFFDRGDYPCLERE